MKQHSIAILATLAALPASAEQFFLENFESGTSGQFVEVESVRAPATGAPVFTYPTGALSGAVPTTSALFDTGIDKELKLENDNGFAALAPNSFFRLSFDYYEPSGGGTAAFADALRIRIGSAIGNAGTMVDFGLSNGVFQKNDQTNLVANAYPENSLIPVIVVVNNTDSVATYDSGAQMIAARTYDVFFNGVLTASDLTFRNPIADPDGTSFNLFFTGVQIAYIDNVRVFTDELGPLDIARDGAGFLLTWPGGGVLQSNDDLAGPWTDVNGGAATSPFAIPAPATRDFFRLRD